MDDGPFDTTQAQGQMITYAFVLRGISEGIPVENLPLEKNLRKLLELSGRVYINCLTHISADITHRNAM
jgi:hypothetical protein